MKVIIIIAIIGITGYLINTIITYNKYLKKSRQSKISRKKNGRQLAIDIHKKHLTEAEIKLLNLRTKDRDTTLEQKLQSIRENNLKIKKEIK